MRICEHCKMDTEIRNPSGFCDHLYYPDCCEVCKTKNPSEIDRLKSQLAAAQKEIEELKAMKFIRCETPQDILVVPKGFNLDSIFPVKNPCHNHTIMFDVEFKQAGEKP